VVHYPAGERDFFYLEASELAVGLAQPPFLCKRGSFLGRRRLSLEVGPSPTDSAKVKII
jgi:hypothetical protein